MVVFQGRAFLVASRQKGWDDHQISVADAGIYECGAPGARRFRQMERVLLLGSLDMVMGAAAQTVPAQSRTAPV